MSQNRDMGQPNCWWSVIYFASMNFRISATV
jgi:hypothetical protein